VLQKVKALLLK